MNDFRGGPGARRPAGAALGLIGPALLIVSCTGNPFGPEESDYGPQAPMERLRSVATLSLNEKPGALGGTSAGKMQPPPDPFEGMEKVDVSIEQARAWTLNNNLDLQVALINPTIEREALSGEEAKFETIFRTRLRYNDIDSPISSTLSSNQAQTFDLVPGVDIPLRTGGTATIELPINRTETNNVFTTLNPSYTTDLRLSMSQPLLRNAGRRASTYPIRIQALNSQIAESRAKLEVIRRLAEVERAYWRLYAAQQLLIVRQDQFELARRQLTQAESRVRAGVAPEVEVVRAQSGVAERLEAIIIAQNRIRDVQRDLKRVMNQDGLKIGSTQNIVITSLPDPVEFDLDPLGLAEYGVTNRMEMLELELQLAQDYSTIEFEKNQALPLFTLDYSYTINGLGGSLGDSVEVMKDNDFEDWAIGANLEVPLGNERAESRVHQAILRRLQRLASKDARELAIRQEVFNAVDQLYAAWQRILASRQAAILAARTLQAEQNQFEVGARTSTDVLNANTTLADARASEIVALTDYQISQVDLAFATGTLMGAVRVDWEPRDPRGPGDFVGEERGRVPLGPPGVPTSNPTEPEVETMIRRPATQPIWRTGALEELLNQAPPPPSSNDSPMADPADPPSPPTESPIPPPNP